MSQGTTSIQGTTSNPSRIVPKGCLLLLVVVGGFLIVFSITTYSSIASTSTSNDQNISVQKRKKIPVLRKPDFDSNSKGINVVHSINIHNDAISPDEFTNATLSPKDINVVHSINIHNDTAISPDEFTNTTLSPKQFDRYPYEFPCIPSDKESGKSLGLHYIKVFKTASSTIAGVVSRTARNHGNDEYSCLYHNSHAASNTFKKLRNRRRNHHKNTFLFTFVREPTKRAISDFGWSAVSQRGKEVNLPNFKDGCCRSTKKLNGQAGFQLAYISNDEKLPQYTFWNSTLDNEKVQHPKLLMSRIDHVFKSYDFIGVTERLDESLVVLYFLLNLKRSDILYISEKHSDDGGYVDLHKGNYDRCIKISKPELTKDITDYLESEEWKARTAGDKLLHQTAMSTLDNTIDNVIGREKFEKKLQSFKAWQDMMAKVCRYSCSQCNSSGQYVGDAARCNLCREEVINAIKKERQNNNL